MTDLERQACYHALDDLQVAPDGATRRRIIQRTASRLGRSEHAVRAWLRELGWRSGRAARSDKGARASEFETDALFLAPFLAANRNKRGIQSLFMKEAWRLAREQQLGIGTLSYSQFVRTLGVLGLDLAHMTAPKATVDQVSDHPNHVAYIDISVGIQWYFRDAATGKRLAQYSDAGARFNENKRGNFAPDRPVLHRYVYVDHYSQAYFVRYYYTPGERAEDMVDFLWHVFSPKGDFARQYPLRGLPTKVVMDQGPANKSGLVRTLLDELDIELELHAPGSAWVSGAVETRHRHWQCTFEGRLRLMPAEDLDAINDAAMKFLVSANSDPTRIVSRTLRAAKTRTPMELWCTIQEDQLRECPDRRTFFSLATGTMREATLTASLHVRHRNRFWQVQDGEGVYRGMKVDYRLSPFTEEGIRVWTKDGRELPVLAITFDDVSGLPTNGKRRVHSEEGGVAHASTRGQQIARKVVTGATPVELPSVWDATTARIETITHLAPEGRAWAPRDTAIAAEPVLAAERAKELVVHHVGSFALLSPEQREWWRNALKDGVTESRLDELVRDFTRATDAPVAMRA